MAKKKEFNIIKDYLMRVKNDYEEQIITFMKTKNIYDYYTEKFLINIKQHQNCYYEILEIIQF